MKCNAFYNLRRQNLLSAQPNAARYALARLENGLTTRGVSLFLCTQNIDDLHERAGSQRVIHMHRELLKARCTVYGHFSAETRLLRISAHNNTNPESGALRKGSCPD